MGSDEARTAEDYDRFHTATRLLANGPTALLNRFCPPGIQRESYEGPPLRPCTQSRRHAELTNGGLHGKEFCRDPRGVAKFGIQKVLLFLLRQKVVSIVDMAKLRVIPPCNRSILPPE